jgi:hypothetical protein
MTVCEVEPKEAQPVGGEDNGGRRSWLRSRWSMPCAFTGLGVLLFFAYLAQASELPIFADGSSQALQAWDMLHGNVLLHGWVLSDVSFYTTELPQYMLIELVRGLHADVVHIAAAMTYSLLVVLSAVLAKGKATGREAWVRVLITVGIMFAPPFGRILHSRGYSSAWVLLSAPDHTGTQVPLVLLWLMLDKFRLERLRQQWWLPVAVLALLAWVEVADPTAIYEGALPIVLVCLVRIYRRGSSGGGRGAKRAGPPGTPRRGGPLAEQWPDLALAVGALASVGFAMGALNVIRSVGGFVVHPASPVLITINGMTVTFWAKLHNLLVLFGADFFGIPAKNALIPFAHLVAVALVVWGVARAVRQVFAENDLAVLAKGDDPLSTRTMQILTMSFLVLLAAFFFGYHTGAREAVGLLPLGAVLAGRMLATRVFEVRLVPILAAVLAFCGLTLARDVVKPALPSPDRPLASWLVAHHLTYGLSASWYASNAVTLYSDGQVKVRDVRFSRHDNLVRLRWNTDAPWYSPKLHDAMFVVTNPCSSVIPARLYTEFGPPTAAYRVDDFTVLVWRGTNLLASQPVRQSGTSHQGGQPALHGPRHPNYAAYQVMCG